MQGIPTEQMRSVTRITFENIEIYMLQKHQ
jgi:hypothetical protein